MKTYPEPGVKNDVWKTKRSSEAVSALSRRDVTWTVEARAEVVRSGGHRMRLGMKRVPLSDRWI